MSFSPKYIYTLTYQNPQMQPKESAMSDASEEVAEFIRTGIHRSSNSIGVFVDPVRLLNRSYSTYRLSPSAYYSRFFQSNQQQQEQERRTASSSRKRKRSATKLNTPNLNQADSMALLRHQEVRPMLVKAHQCFLEATDLLRVLPTLRDITSVTTLDGSSAAKVEVEQSFVELAKLWQAPLFNITLKFHSKHVCTSNDGVMTSADQEVLPVFDNLVSNETMNDVEAEVFDREYILPRNSCFLMSDMVHVNKLIPESSDCGFNLIVIDPPWENGSARQKSMYPTLPNKYFLSLPIKKLAHAEGALVALWVTNREKLRNFVERELFDKWEVKHVATYYWLKVKADGSLISELDLSHHKPYECLLLAYCYSDVVSSTKAFKNIQDNVIISIPGDYSRKPPLADILKEYVPGSKPKKRYIELFAREMASGWMSWGNEPLHFQDSRYFTRPVKS